MILPFPLQSELALSCESDTYLAKKVINCGGNYSDELDRLVPRNSNQNMLHPAFVIKPGCLHLINIIF